MNQNIEYNPVKRRIKILRLRNKMTQEELAKKLGSYTATVISSWERGFRYPSSINIIKLCNIFNTSADYILGLTKEVTK